MFLSIDPQEEIAGQMGGIQPTQTNVYDEAFVIMRRVRSLTALRPCARRALHAKLSTLPPSTLPLTIGSQVRSQFEEDGFVMMEGLLPMSTVEALLSRWGGDSW